MLELSELDCVMTAYRELLNMFGWSKEDYERELLSKIDTEWSAIHFDTVLNSICLN